MKRPGELCAFWDDVARGLRNSEFISEYVAVAEEIASIDARYRRP